MWLMNSSGQLPRCDVCGAVLEEAFGLMDHLHREPVPAPMSAWQLEKRQNRLERWASRKYGVDVRLERLGPKTQGGG
jgi:hypothetical protein